MYDKYLKKQKKLKVLLSLVIIAVVIYACSSTKWGQSPARDDYKTAQDQYKDGNHLEAMVTISGAIIKDPIQPKPKEFLYEKCDKTLSEINAELNQTKGTKSIKEVERRYYLYGKLIELNNNFNKISFPIKHPKGKWSWSAKITDYTKEREETRVYAYDVIYGHGKTFLSQNNVEQANSNFAYALTNYANANEKASKQEIIYNDLFTYASKQHETEDLNLVTQSYYAYTYAQNFKASDEAKKGAEDTKLKVSDLWVLEGEKQEKLNTLTSLETAHSYYENALNWNPQNIKAPELKEGIKPKIAELYYQQGLAAEKEANRDFNKIKEIYAKATNWVPDYKDVAKRLNVFSILVEIQSVQNNMTVTESEHGKLTQRVTTVANGVNSTKEMLDKITYVSDKIRSLNDGMKLTAKILKALGPIPYIGTACKGTSMAITTARTPIESAVTFFNDVEKPIITPTKEAVEKSKVRVDAVKSQMDKTQAYIKHTRQVFATAESCLWKFEKEEEFNEYAIALKGINSALAPINSSLTEINNGLAEVESKSNAVKQIAAGFAPNMEVNIKAFEPAINAIADATHEIEKVLKKEKWGFSAEKILNGVSGVMDFMTGWAEDLLKPYIDKLAAQIPQLPGLEEMKAEINKFQTAFAELNTAYDKLNKAYENYTNYEKIIVQNLNKVRSHCISGKAYYIQSAQEYGKSKKGYLDIPSSDPVYEAGQNIQVWELDKGEDRKFYVEAIGSGYVKLSPAHGVTLAYIDVAGNKSEDGTNIQIWDKNDSNAQKFKLKKTGEGKYKIVNANGKVLCLANRSSENGSNVHIWSDHSGAFTEWVFIDPSTNKIVDPLK